LELKIPKSNKIDKNVLKEFSMTQKIKQKAEKEKFDFLNLQENQVEKILNFLKQNPKKYFIRSEISKSLGINFLYLNQILADLYRQNKIDLLTIGKNACFRFKQEGSKE
jgi:uncharacterized protein YabN with tetrapyrrole methylase and pyrophosphatase domain